MKAQLWFYKGPGHIFDQIIRWWTDSIYSHVEIVVDGIAYGADAWQGRVRVANTSTFNRDNWDVFEITAIHDTAWLNAQLGKKYDWLGIMGFLLFRVDDPSRWYCSELAAAFIGIQDRPVSPGDLVGKVI